MKNTVDYLVDKAIKNWAAAYKKGLRSNAILAWRPEYGYDPSLTSLTPQYVLDWIQNIREQNAASEYPDRGIVL